MNRKNVTEQEIVDWVNARLKDEFDGDFSIKHVQRLQGLDENGCNWNVSFISGGFDPGIHGIIQEAKDIFNLEQ